MKPVPYQGILCTILPWLRPDEFSVTFHSVGALQEADLQQYLAAHQVRSSADVLKAKLAKF